LKKLSCLCPLNLLNFFRTMFSTLFFSAVSAKLSLQVEMFASNSGSCGGDRFLRVAVEFDPCAISNELCTAMESVDCDMIEQGLRDVKNAFPDQPIPTFGDCYKLDMEMLEEEEQEILDCLPTASPTSVFRRAETPDLRMVQQFKHFLNDVVMPSVNRRRQDFDYSALAGLDDFTMGDMKLSCGGAHISSMSAGTAALTTFGVMGLIFVVAIVALCSLFNITAKAAPNQDLEMAPAATAEGHTSSKVDV